MAEELGQEYGKVSSYGWTSLGDYNIIMPSYFNLKNLPVDVISTSDDKQLLEKVITKFSEFRYVESQADPYKLWTSGGNCQAISLYLYETFKRNGLETGLKLDLGLEHMSAWVVVDGVRYNVDLVQQKVEVL